MDRRCGWNHGQGSPAFGFLGVSAFAFDGSPEDEPPFELSFLRFALNLPFFDAAICGEVFVADTGKPDPSATLWAVLVGMTLEKHRPFFEKLADLRFSTAGDAV